MKSLVLTLAIFIAGPAMAASAYTYDCGDITAQVVTTAKPTVKLKFAAMNDKGQINVVSNTQGDTLTENSLAFVQFVYPNGGACYVTAECETMEEGFTFTIDQAATQGAATVKATTTYWSDWSDANSDELTCTLK